MTDNEAGRDPEESVRHEPDAPFQIVADQSPNMIFINRGGRVVYANHTCEEQMGYTREEFCAPGFDFRSLVAPESLELVTQNFGRHMGGEELAPYEYWLVARDGRRLLGLHATRLIEYKGAPAILGIITDITERKRVEEELRRLRTAVEASGEVVFMTDREGTIQFVNPAFTKTYGWTPEEVVGKQTPRILKSGKMDADYYDHLWEELTAGRVVDLDIVNRSKDGRLLLVEGSSNPVQDESGEIIGFLAVQRDVTDRRRAEEQFLRGQRMESLGTMSGGIAHDLNNVLTPILMSVEFLRSRLKDAEDLRHIDRLESSARRGADLVKQVLTFSRGSEMERRWVRVDGAVDELVGFITETFPSNIKVVTTIAGGPDWVLGDPTQIHQVLLNLCLNARDAMSPAGGVLEIRVEEAPADGAGAEDGHTVLISVVDGGHGIDPAVRERIFEPFFTTKELGHGTGLGLSTVFAVVKNHGGSVQCESVPGAGATFTVRLPARDRAGPIPTPNEPGPGGGAGQLILVVEDEPAILEVTHQALSLHGYRVVPAGSAEEALTLYDDLGESADLLLTDLNMPGMDGAELIRALRKKAPGLPVIVVTGLADRERLESVVDTATIRILSKPYSQDRLLGMVGEALASDR